MAEFELVENDRGPKSVNYAMSLSLDAYKKAVAIAKENRYTVRQMVSEVVLIGLKQLKGGK